MTRFLKIAEKVASQSQHPQHRLGCVIVKGGAVLSTAANGGPQCGHAEARALRPHQCFKGATLFVVRTNGKRISKPCNECATMIKKAGIRLVVCRDIDGFIKKLKP